MKRAGAREIGSGESSDSDHGSRPVCIVIRSGNSWAARLSLDARWRSGRLTWRCCCRSRRSTRRRGCVCCTTGGSHSCSHRPSESQSSTSHSWSTACIRVNEWAFPLCRSAGSFRRRCCAGNPRPRRRAEHVARLTASIELLETIAGRGPVTARRAAARRRTRPHQRGHGPSPGALQALGQGGVNRLRGVARGFVSGRYHRYSLGAGKRGFADAVRPRGGRSPVAIAARRSRRAVAVAAGGNGSGIYAAALWAIPRQPFSATSGTDPSLGRIGEGPSTV